MRIGLVPDDVLLVPRAAPEKGMREEWGGIFERVIPDEAFDGPQFAERDLSSRTNVDTSTFIDKGQTIRLKIPIVSAPMADVTQSDLAIALAKEGGVGIIHRAQTEKEEAAEVALVKSQMGFIFERPPTLPPTATVFDARGKMNRGLVVVTDRGNHVLGVVTRRDVKKDHAPQDLLLAQVMTPQKKVVTIIPEVDTTDPFAIFVRRRDGGQKIKATDLMWRKRVEKLIIVDENNRLIGAITDFDQRQLREKPDSTLDNKGQLVVGAAIGINGNYLKRAEAVIAAGADFLCIDVANGYLKTVRIALKTLKKRFPHIPIMVGSTVTRQGARILAEEGADAIRNGIGGGSICITRGVSGFGVPGLTSTLEVADEADKYRVPMVADGGIRNSSDVAKYLAAGARAVMLGRLLASSEEAAGQLIIDSDTMTRHHEYRGMASESVRRELEAAGGRTSRAYARKPEGVPQKVKIVGTVFDITQDLVRGLQSGCTYGGVTNLEQLRNEVDFVRVTSAGQREGGVQNF